MNAALEAKVRRKPRRVRPTTAEHETRLSQLDRAAFTIGQDRDRWRDYFWLAVMANPVCSLVAYLLARHV